MRSRSLLLPSISGPVWVVLPTPHTTAACLLSHLRSSILMSRKCFYSALPCMSLPTFKLLWSGDRRFRPPLPTLPFHKPAGGNRFKKRSTQESTPTTSPLPVQPVDYRAMTQKEPYGAAMRRNSNASAYIFVPRTTAATRPLQLLHLGNPPIFATYPRQIVLVFETGVQ